MIFLLQDVSPPRGRYTYLEGETGLTAARWQNLFLRRLYPSMDMVYAAMHLVGPRYKKWLISGDDLTLKREEKPDDERWVKFNQFNQREKTAKERTAQDRAEEEASKKE